MSILLYSLTLASAIILDSSCYSGEVSFPISIILFAVLKYFTPEQYMKGSINLIEEGLDVVFDIFAAAQRELSHPGDSTASKYFDQHLKHLFGGTDIKEEGSCK